jgi:hypothetical protein
MNAFRMRIGDLPSVRCLPKSPTEPSPELLPAQRGTSDEYHPSDVKCWVCLCCVKWGSKFLARDVLRKS